MIHGHRNCNTDTSIQEVVKGLWSHMSDIYGTTVHKKSAPEMRLIARLLSFVRIVDMDTFYKQYSTVLGTRIYVPFTVGVASNHHSLWDQAVACAHEHQHVEQFLTHGLQYLRGYLLDSRRRAIYESEAYSASSELTYWRYGYTQKSSVVANRLRDYGCTDLDIAHARKIIDEANEQIELGFVSTASGQWAISWLTTHAPDLQAPGSTLGDM